MPGTMLDAAHGLVIGCKYGGWELFGRESRVLALFLRGGPALGSIVPAGSWMRGANRRLLLIGQMRASGGLFFCAYACVAWCFFFLDRFLKMVLRTQCGGGGGGETDAIFSASRERAALATGRGRG